MTARTYLVPAGNWHTLQIYLMAYLHLFHLSNLDRPKIIILPPLFLPIINTAPTVKFHTPYNFILFYFYYFYIYYNFHERKLGVYDKQTQCQKF